MTPLFYSKYLTGYTKNIGLFDSRFKPSNIQGQALNHDLLNTNFTQNSGRYSSSLYLPTYILSQNDYHRQKYHYLANAVKLATYNGLSLYANLAVHAINIEYTGAIYNRRIKSAQIIYESSLFIKDKAHTRFELVKRLATQDANRTTHIYCLRPYEWFNEQLKNLAEFNAKPALDSWYRSLSLKQILVNQANYLANNLTEIMRNYGHDSLWCQNFLNNIYHYDLMLNSYKQIFDELQKKHLSQKDYQAVISSNEYLLLTANLETLNSVKDQLPTVKEINFKSSDYNKQQLQAIKSPYSLNLLQSVAGSGKSHTILGRIKYLLKAGIDPKQITAISFTNAAANHLAQNQPDINSLTISKMIHDAYQSNFSHVLSNLSTLVNSIKLNYNYADPVAKPFVNLLKQVINNQKQSTIHLMHFINQHYEHVIQILNKINQTSLELEEIICYLNTDKKTWHDPYQTKFLIVDEVQDTSIFQFVFLLRYSTSNKLNVFFVGDASQTLYAFRDADPEALNALEATNYFTAYKLETNYRSRPGILYYANKMLATVDANKYANLRLHAPNWTSDAQEEASGKYLPVDAFKKQVMYGFDKSLSTKNINDQYCRELYGKFLSYYLLDNLHQHRKTAFLSYTQKVAIQTAKTLHEIYPNAKITSLLTPKTEMTSAISSYLDQYSNELNFIPTNNLPNILLNAIDHKVLVLDKTISDPVKQDVLDNLSQFLASYWPPELDKYQAGKTSHKDLINALKTQLLAFEIDYNTENQKYFDTATLQQLDGIKEADFIISTIHSSKGLEFDNVVLMMTNTDRLTQEARRLYYVALTRAKQTEVIVEASRSKSDPDKFYEDCIRTLESKK